MPINDLFDQRESAPGAGHLGARYTVEPVEYASHAVFGDAGAVVNRKTSPSGSPNAAAYYIEHAYQDTHTPNMVTAILADYRGYDTMFETVVIYCAGMAVLSVLWRKKEE